MEVKPQDLLSALVGDPAARVRLADAAAGSQDTLAEYAQKIGGNLGPLAPLLAKVTAGASARSNADTQAALKGAASGNLGTIAKGYALPVGLGAAALAFLLFMIGRSSK